MASEAIRKYVAAIRELEAVVRAQRPTRYSPDVLEVLHAADTLQQHIGSTP